MAKPAPLTVLLVTDPSRKNDYAVERTVLLANELRVAKIIVVHAVPFALHPWLGMFSTRRRRGEAASMPVARFADVLRRRTRAQVHAFAWDTGSRALDHIARLCGSADFMVISGASNGLLGALFGRLGVAAALRSARMPVLVVKRQPVLPYKRAVVAFDERMARPRATIGARVVAPHASIEVIHTYRSPFEGKLSYAGVRQEIIEHYRERERYAALHRLMDALAREGMREKVTPRVVHGDLALKVLDRLSGYPGEFIATDWQDTGIWSRLLVRDAPLRLLERSPADLLICPVGDPAEDTVRGVTPAFARAQRPTG